MSVIQNEVVQNSFQTHDRDVLRGLAGQVAELAARPDETTKRALWHKHNALQGERPMVVAFPEIGWCELVADLVCEHPLARKWEQHLRQVVFAATEIRDDRVITSFFDVPHVHTDSGWGLDVERIGGEDRGAYTWHSPLKNYDDFDKLKFPEIIIDLVETHRRLELANEVFGDLLDVRLRTSWFWTMGLTWTLVDLRGMEQIMFDMIDDPDNLHRLMAFLRDGHMAKLDFLEQNNLFSLNNDDSYVGSGGFGWTDELPGTDFDGEQVRCADRWGFAESQETVGVSPKMFAEFVFPYQLPILERFGLNCYGCCEPLDARWHIVKQVPRLRRVSVSPWADRAKMTGFLEDQYIFSMKPHPGVMATSSFNEDGIRHDLRQDLEGTRGCHIEIIMKDTTTFHDDPTRPGRWVQIAREEIDQVYHS